MLKPLPGSNAEPEYGTDSPTVQCEACPKTGPSHLMINVMVCCGSPGHPSITGFQCPHVEHWACSLPCWRKIAHACVDEHMHVILTAFHQQLGLIKE